MPLSRRKEGEENSEPVLSKVEVLETIEEESVVEESVVVHAPPGQTKKDK